MRHPAVLVKTDAAHEVVPIDEEVSFILKLYFNKKFILTFYFTAFFKPL